MSDHPVPAGAGRIGIRQRLRLFFIVFAVVFALSLVKAGVHLAGWEFLGVNLLFPSVVAGAIFIIGFLLSSILADYKECERLPAEIRAALETIHDEAVTFSQSASGIDIARLRRHLCDIVGALHDGLNGTSCDLKVATARVDELSPVIDQLVRLGMVSNYVVRMRNAQDNLRRSFYRIHYIEKLEFVPSVHVLVQTLVAATLVLLVFIRTDSTFESALIFGFVSYMFVYALYLVEALETPFRKAHDNSVDDVSLFLLRDFVEKLREPADARRFPSPVEDEATLKTGTYSQAAQ